MDMDECMLCCEERIGSSNFKSKPGLETLTIHMGDTKMKVHLRPGLRTFLHEVSKFADMYVMTVAHSMYADPAIQAIDPNGSIFKGIYSRDYFKHSRGKDLRLLGDRFDIKRTVLVDNMVENFAIQPSNGILVREFYDNPEDTHLNDVLKLLKKLVDVSDVRKILRPHWNQSGVYSYKFADEFY